MSFYDIDIVDLFYLLNSDTLNISHERFILFYLYTYMTKCNLKEAEILLKTVRFNFLELGIILDFARDHVIV